MTVGRWLLIQKRALDNVSLAGESVETDRRGVWDVLTALGVPRL